MNNSFPSAPHIRERKFGFTLLEMMVVLTICLVMIVLLVPIFQVVTKTAQNVEVKLAVYESARNILDNVEYEIRMATINERCDLFQIKSFHYFDSDTAAFRGSREKTFPAAGTQPSPVTFDTMAYRGYRREADGIGYVKMQGGGYRFVTNLKITGSQGFPLSYPDIYATTPEAWKCSMDSSLQYGYMTPYPTEQMIKRAKQLPNLTSIQLNVAANSLFADIRVDATSVQVWDALYNTLAPGFEFKLPGYFTDWNLAGEDPNREGAGMTNANNTFTLQRRSGAIQLMDFDVAYWDAGVRKFRDLPDKTLLALAPAPKAIRVTITCCDREKRAQVTLCRVIQLPVGNGVCDAFEDSPTGQITRTVDPTRDAKRMDLDQEPYNRCKDLTVIDYRINN
jgi:prepilin-type N-terminal cleavage/methylation domain-containing protein